MRKLVVCIDISVFLHKMKLNPFWRKKRIKLKMLQQLMQTVLMCGFLREKNKMEKERMTERR